MIASVPWVPARRGVLASMLLWVATWRLRRGCRAQARRGAELAAWHRGLRGRIEADAAWLRDGVNWDSVAAACPAGSLERLAVALGLDMRTCGARLLFLTALSTRSTYEEAWRLVLGFTAGEERARLLGIRALEDEINAANEREISTAGFLLRGLSADEFEDVHGGSPKPGEIYQIVSMTPVPQVAKKFALRNLHWRSIPHVVVVIDAAWARRLGAQPALYALASDALGLRPSQERAHRAFKLLYAAERQAHFDLAWPLGSSLAIRAVAPVGDPSPDVLRRLERTGIPVVAIEDLM